MDQKPNKSPDKLGATQIAAGAVLICYIISIVLLWWIYRDPSNFSQTSGFTSMPVFVGITFWCLMWFVTIVFTIVIAFMVRVGTVCAIAMISAIGFACYVENSILAVVSPAVILSAVLCYIFQKNSKVY